MEEIDRALFANGLIRIVELHDIDTATHLRATGALARRIADHLRLPTETAADVELAGLLHDIGKVQVGREILCKPAELTPNEWVEMRGHAAAGATVLESVPVFAPLVPIVRAHHERMDGHGYPDRLRRDEIPLEARIVAVADAFHALTTDRPYRRAILPQAALVVLKTAAGAQFDPDVVTATLDVFGRRGAAGRLSA
jgi:putative nucleotidyltransferase with HDIG domain